MRSRGEAIYIGMMGCFLQQGLVINKLDIDKQQLYITIPDKSYVYDEAIANASRLQSAEDFAKRVKEIFIEMGIFKDTCTVKYRTINGYWTKEDGTKNYNENIHKYTSLMLGY